MTIKTSVLKFYFYELDLSVPTYISYLELKRLKKKKAKEEEEEEEASGPLLFFQVRSQCLPSRSLLRR